MAATKQTPKPRPKPRRPRGVKTADGETWAVAKGKTLDCKRGHLKAGDIVEPRFVGGEHRLKDLASAGILEIVEPPRKPDPPPPPGGGEGGNTPPES
jgi:hypothetical protein